MYKMNEREMKNKQTDISWIVKILQLCKNRNCVLKVYEFKLGITIHTFIP